MVFVLSCGLETRRLLVEFEATECMRFPETNPLELGQGEEQFSLTPGRYQDTGQLVSLSQMGPAKVWRLFWWEK